MAVDVSRVAKNLKCLRKKKGYTLVQAAEKLGLPHHSTYSAWERGDNVPKLNNLLEITRHYSISLEELVNEDLCADKPQINFIGYSIPIVPFAAAASQIEGYADPEYIVSLDQIVIPHKPPAGLVMAFPIQGKSMEPDFEDGSYVVASRINNAVDVSDGGYYIVETRTMGLMFKQLFNRKTETELELVSLNRDIQKPFKITYQEVKGLWKYFCAISKPAF